MGLPPRSWHNYQIFNIKAKRWFTKDGEGHRPCAVFQCVCWAITRKGILTLVASVSPSKATALSVPSREHCEVEEPDLKSLQFSVLHLILSFAIKIIDLIFFCLFPLSKLHLRGKITSNFKTTTIWHSLDPPSASHLHEILLWGKPPETQIFRCLWTHFKRLDCPLSYSMAQHHASRAWGSTSELSILKCHSG